MTEDKEQKLDEFVNNAFSIGRMEKIKLLSSGTSELRAALEEALPDGKEKEIALIKLEEVLMWSCRGLAKTIKTQVNEESTTDES